MLLHLRASIFIGLAIAGLGITATLDAQVYQVNSATADASRVGFRALP